MTNKKRLYSIIVLTFANLQTHCMGTVVSVKSNQTAVATSSTSTRETDLLTAICTNNEYLFHQLIADEVNTRGKPESGVTPLHCAVAAGNEEFTRILLFAGVDKNIPDFDGETPLSLAVKYGHTQIALMLHINGERTDCPRVKHFLETCQGYDDMRGVLVLKSINPYLNIHDHNADGKTLLLAAASNGHTTLVKYLLYLGSPINTQKNNGYTALHEAALNGHAETVNLLLSLEANLELKSSSGETPLHIAARAGKVKVVQLLLAKNADTRKQDVNGETPLFAAVNGGHREVAQLLLQHGAEIDAQRGDLHTPLGCAIHSDNAAMVDMLLRNGAQKNGIPNCLFNPLHIAVQMNRGDIVSLLISHGVDLNVQSIGGATPLIGAISRHTDIALRLIQAGANVNTPNDDGATPLIYAASQGQCDVVKALLNAGAETDRATITPRGHTALAAAAALNHFEIVKLLVDNNAPIEAPLNGPCPLLLASEAGYSKVVELLLEKKARVDAAQDGLTPLIRAAQNGHLPVIELLLKKEIDLESRWQGKTALDLAREAKHTDIVTLLEQKSQQLKNSKSNEPKASASLSEKRKARQAGIAKHVPKGQKDAFIDLSESSPPGTPAPPFSDSKKNSTQFADSLFKAVEENDLAEVELLLRCSPTQLTDDLRATLLRIACEKGYTSIVTLYYGKRGYL